VYTIPTVRHARAGVLAGPKVMRKLTRRVMALYCQCTCNVQTQASGRLHGGLTGQAHGPVTSAYRVCGNAILPLGCEAQLS
jgi:hypothetical protein